MPSSSLSPGDGALSLLPAELWGIRNGLLQGQETRAEVFASLLPRSREGWIVSATMPSTGGGRMVCSTPSRGATGEPAVIRSVAGSGTHRNGRDGDAGLRLGDT